MRAPSLIVDKLTWHDLATHLVLPPTLTCLLFGLTTSPCPLHEPLEVASAKLERLPLRCLGVWSKREALRDSFKVRLVLVKLRKLIAHRISPLVAAGPGERISVARRTKKGRNG